MIERTARSGRATVKIMLVNAVVCAVAYGLANHLDIAQSIEWMVQTQTTTGYGNYPATNTLARWISVYAMVSSFVITLALAAHFVAWLLPDSWTHEEAEETEAKIDAICHALGIDPAHIEKEIN